jgi:hypothetical protein
MIWLQGRRKRLIQPHLDALIQDATTQFIIFSNKPEHVAMKEQTGKSAVTACTDRASKQMRLPYVLRAEMEGLCEIVVTNLGGEGVSAVLIGFVEWVKQAAEQGGVGA